jgi:hypothetical protein
MNEMGHTGQVPQNDAVLPRNCREMIRMNKHFLAVAIAVAAVSVVLATGVATASLGATAAATGTKLTLSVSPTTVKVGDSMTVKGRLVDANGKGIPSQVIHLNAQATAMGTTVNRPQPDAKTDASGNYGGTGPVDIGGQNVPSAVKQATVKLTATYDGNAQYAACQSSPATFTVNFQ